MTWKELIYICLDLCKITNEDAYYTEDHVAFLLSKMRSLILKQTYSDIRKVIPTSNYQTICLDLELTPSISGETCEHGVYLKSKELIPTTMPVGNTEVYPTDYYQGTITFVSRERMKYVGYNRWLQNFIYASLGPDNHLYLKSLNPQFLYMKKVKMTGIFEDAQKASELSCTDKGNEENCDLYEKSFPLEEGLVMLVIDLTLKELLGASYRPKDDYNNAIDDLSDLITFIRRNSKNSLRKAIENDT